MNPPALNRSQWERIDTVLLDMDGTVLDLAFDNRFWRSHVPQAWALKRSLSAHQAREQLEARFREREGTLDWYCIDYWSRELQLDIPALKRQQSDQIRWLPGARDFLCRVRALGKRLVLITNAHPTTLAIKDACTQVISHFDAGFSSHTFGAPKEHATFWRELAKVEQFDPARSLFVDDSLSVLRAARAAGIGLIYAVHHPDTDEPPRMQQEFPAVNAVADLL
jgi:5'-nucleotidase